jgi:hypothetical protein
MKRGLAAALTLSLALPALAQDAAPVVSDAPTAAAKPAPAIAAKPAIGAAASPVGAPVVAKRAASVVPVQGVTPNAERIVTIGAINKRTGETRTFVGKPGQMFDFYGLHVVVRTCETTPPWEQRLTGAFLLIDERMLKGNPKRVYSGWMFAESPSLHPLEHPRYDIWVKSCTMRFPDTGPDTVVAGRGDSEPVKAVAGGKPAAGASANVSIAKKSAETPKAVAN